MALEPPPFAVLALGPFPKQVSTLLWRMNILPSVGRRGPNNLVQPSLRVQIIPGTALSVGAIYAFLLVTQTVEGYGPILSIRLLHMYSPMDILKDWYTPGKVPPIDGNFGERPEPSFLGSDGNKFCSPCAIPSAFVDYAGNLRLLRVAQKTRGHSRVQNNPWGDRFGHGSAFAYVSFLCCLLQVDDGLDLEAWSP